MVFPLPSVQPDVNGLGTANPGFLEDDVIELPGGDISHRNFTNHHVPLPRSRYLSSAASYDLSTQNGDAMHLPGPTRLPDQVGRSISLSLDPDMTLVHRASPKTSSVLEPVFVPFPTTFEEIPMASRLAPPPASASRRTSVNSNGTVAGRKGSLISQLSATPAPSSVDIESSYSNEGYSDDEKPTLTQRPLHIDDELPPMEIVENVMTAVRMPNDIPIIDTLVVEVPMGKEKLKGLILQIFVPFLLAGFGMVGAGILLDMAQSWTVFVEISEILIMVPALLGLKGNLEMTLASRLSTQVNIGGFQNSRRKWRIIGCNVALNQVLSTVVGCLASVLAVVMYAIHHGGGVKTRNVILMFGTAMLSACSTSVVQDTVMIGTVLFAKRFRMNPDNIATPVAGMVGDVLTLSILAGFSYMFYSAFETSYWLVGPVVAICCLVCLVPMWVWLARKEATTRHVLVHGWVPVIMAMIISSCSGIILEQVVSTGLFFKGLAVFQPLINGVGGNIVSVQASRIATYLHLAYKTPGHVPPMYISCSTPCHAFCARSNVNARTARLLLMMVVPGHLIFLFIVTFAKTDGYALSLRFAVVFIIMALLQVSMLLYLADVLTHFAWKKGLDPDNQTIPYLTALGDLTGTGLLALAFFLLYITGKTDSVQ